MNDRLSFVQFLHPGGEHGWDERTFDGRGVTRWKIAGKHRRKSLREHGGLREGGDAELVFRGEWEPPSRVSAIDASVPGGPHFVDEPFFPRVPGSGWKQNTDPRVFGDRLPPVEEIVDDCVSAATGTR
jgi:hypothetical protein